MRVEFQNLKFNKNFKQNISIKKTTKDITKPVSSENMLNALNLKGLNNISFGSLVTKETWSNFKSTDLHKASRENAGWVFDDDYNYPLLPPFIDDKEVYYKRLDTAKKIIKNVKPSENKEYEIEELFNIAFDKRGESEDETLRQNFAINLSKHLDPKSSNCLSLSAINRNILKDDKLNKDLVNYIQNSINKKTPLKDYYSKYNKLEQLVQMYKETNIDFFDTYTDELKEHLNKIKISSEEFTEIFKIKNRKLSEKQLDILADLKLNADMGKFDGEFLNKFSNLKLDKRLQTKTIVDDSTVKADLIESKYSTFYKVENKTYNHFISRKIQSLVKNSRYSYTENLFTPKEYRCKFPDGNWRATKGVELKYYPYGSISYTPEYVKDEFKIINNSCFSDLGYISLEPRDTEYFEKIS